MPPMKVWYKGGRWRHPGRFDGCQYLRRRCRFAGWIWRSNQRCGLWYNHQWWSSVTIRRFRHARAPRNIKWRAAVSARVWDNELGETAQCLKHPEARRGYDFGLAEPIQPFKRFFCIWIQMKILDESSLKCKTRCPIGLNWLSQAAGVLVGTSYLHGKSHIPHLGS